MMKKKNYKSYERGKHCEKKAIEFFEKQSYKLVEKNYLVAGVEVDLILKNEKGYVLVEVKSDNAWRLEQPMSFQQKKKLFRAFSYFCEQYEEPVEIKLALVDYKDHVRLFDLEF